ncbi:MAG: hypothetical protein ICV85_10130 [Tolypothrix sp. T3-bin4]|nr:hypothetical protein [Tolypothrix sp. T3-bin4]
MQLPNPLSPRQVFARSLGIASLADNRFPPKALKSGVMFFDDAYLIKSSDRLFINARWEY